MIDKKLAVGIVADDEDADRALLANVVCISNPSAPSNPYDPIDPAYTEPDVRDVV